MPKEITGQIVERIPTEMYAFLEIRVNIYGDDPHSAVNLLEKTKIELELDEREEKPTNQKKPEGKLTSKDLPQDMIKELKITEDDDYHYVRIKSILGGERFGRLAPILRGHGYEYITEGKKSHFRKPKQ